VVDLRNNARGRDCMVMLPGICNHRSETVVLAHVRLSGVTGVGQKAPDLLGAWCCSACHDEVDRRTSMLDRDKALLWFYEGVLRTQNELIKLGLIKV